MKFKKKEIGKISIMVVIICFLLNPKQLFSQGKIAKQFNFSDIKKHGFHSSLDTAIETHNHVFRNQQNYFCFCNIF